MEKSKLFVLLSYKKLNSYLADITEYIRMDRRIKWTIVVIVVVGGGCIWAEGKYMACVLDVEC